MSTKDKKYSIPLFSWRERIMTTIFVTLFVAWVIVVCLAAFAQEKGKSYASTNLYRSVNSYCSNSIVYGMLMPLEDFLVACILTLYIALITVTLVLIVVGALS